MSIYSNSSAAVPQLSNETAHGAKQVTDGFAALLPQIAAERYCGFSHVVLCSDLLMSYDQWRVCCDSRVEIE